MTVFETLNSLNVNGHTEQKQTDGGRTTLTYLSWPWAWAEVKKHFPDAHYEVVKNADGLPFFADDRLGIMVYTKVTIDGVTHEMWLPVMDGNNKAMRFEAYEVATKYKTIQVKAATMFDVNKTVMRCLVKNLAMFGLGLYIYAGEDLPEGETEKALDDAESDLPADAVKPGQKVDLPKKGDFNGLAAITEWCNTRQIAMQDFAAARQTAIDKKWIADIKSKDLTETDCLTLFDAVEQILSGAVK